MQLKMNKDVLQVYKDNSWKGFSAKELLSLLAGAGIAITVVAALYFGAGVRPDVAVYLGVPIAAPVILAGFFRYQGYLKPKQLLYEIRRTQSAERMIYASGEWDGNYRLFTLHRKPERRRNIGNRKEKYVYRKCQKTI